MPTLTKSQKYLAQCIAGNDLQAARRALVNVLAEDTVRQRKRYRLTLSRNAPESAGRDIDGYIQEQGPIQNKAERNTMGVTITATNPKYEFDMGYVGFLQLRKEIALALDEEFGRNYADLAHCHPQNQNGRQGSGYTIAP